MQGQQAAKCPPGRAYRDRWQAHIKAALKEETLPVVILSSRHFLPKAPANAEQILKDLQKSRDYVLRELEEREWESHWDVPKEDDWRRELRKIEARMRQLQHKMTNKPMPMDSVPCVPVYPLSVLCDYLGCKKRYLFTILRIHRVSYYPVRAPGAKETVWVVLASNRLEEVFNSLALRRNKKPLKLANLAYPLIDIDLLPEEHRSLAYALCAVAMTGCPKWQPADYLPLSWQGFTFLPWRIVSDSAVFSVPKGAAKKIAAMPLQALKKMGFRRLVERLPAWLRRGGDGKFRKGLPDDLYDALLTLKKDIERGRAVRRRRVPLFDPTYIIRCAVAQYRRARRFYDEEDSEALREKISQRFSRFNEIASAADKVESYLATYLELWESRFFDEDFSWEIDLPVVLNGKKKRPWQAQPIPSVRWCLEQREMREDWFA
jgi:hypothetical protein